MSAILLSIVVLLAAAGIAFVNQRSFGRLPRGERLERIRRSPNYRDGQFRNLHPTPQMTSDKGFAGTRPICCNWTGCVFWSILC